MAQTTDHDLLLRIASALERLAPPAPTKPAFDAAEAFVWQASPEGFLPIPHINRVPLALLKRSEERRVGKECAR